MNKKLEKNRKRGEGVGIVSHKGVEETSKTAGQGE
jgi:hypothetical protein